VGVNNNPQPFDVAGIMNATHAGGFGANTQMGAMNTQRRVGLMPGVTGAGMKNDQ
jgi:hypothetical protein